VPQFRGSPVSVPFDDVLARARAFLAAGFREIVLTGCNLSLYRSAGHGLPDLAAALAALESPGHRIRLGSIEPGLCDAPLLDAIEANPNICRFLHLSLQSGSDPVLARTYIEILAVAVLTLSAAQRASFVFGGSSPRLYVPVSAVAALLAIAAAAEGGSLSRLALFAGCAAVELGFLAAADFR
jgi:threonylcarbamoyladenosine tRNA methylthiotransferase MtaB